MIFKKKQDAAAQQAAAGEARPAGKDKVAAFFRKNWKWMVPVACVAVLGGWFILRPYRAQDANVDVNYVQTTPEKRDLSNSLSGTGTLNPANTYNVKSLVAGKVLTSTFEEGDVVEEGTVLYTIDSKGDIDFPVLGKIHVGGLSREQVASTIKEQLFKEDLVKDAVVSVEFGGIHFSVLGEVNKPGQYNFENDRETILDAISRAGDLTIYGQRDHVTVIRTEGGERKVYNINMLSGQDITSSPAYYLKQGDIIYVDPNPTRARQSTVNGNTFRSSAFWVSMASLAMSVTMLIKNW